VLQNRLAFILLIGATLSATAASAATKLTLAQLLAAPPTPGTITRLIPYRNQPGVLDRWRLGLESTEARTRAATGRAITAAGAASLFREIVIALESETDLDAQVELIRSLLVFGSPETEEVLLRTLATRNPAVRAEIMVIVAQRRGTGALALLGTEWFDGLALPTDAIARFLRAATASSRWGPSRAFARVVELDDGALLECLVPLMRLHSTEVPDDLIEAAFSSEQDELRARVAWYLVEHHARRARRDGAVLLSALPRRLDPAEHDLDERFAHEMLRRVLGAPVEEREEQLEAIAAIEQLARHERDPAVLRLLTPAELAALDRANESSGGRPNELREAVGRSEETEPEVPPTGGDTGFVRQVTVYPDGLVGDVLRACGCDADKDDVVVSGIRWADGPRPSRVELHSWPDRAGCEEAAELLAMTAMPGDDWRLEGHRPQLAVTLLGAEARACAESHRRGSEVGREIDARRIQWPRPIEQVAPRYPKHLKKRHIEGVVSVRAVVTRDGCTTELAAYHGDEIALQLAALKAFARWRFEPGRLDGEAAAVVFTTTTKFTSR